MNQKNQMKIINDSYIALADKVAKLIKGDLETMPIKK